MKRCPECGRDYDNSMSFCLDDGAELLYGPANAVEPATAILHDSPVSTEAATRAQFQVTDRPAQLSQRIETEHEGKSRSFQEKQNVPGRGTVRLITAGVLTAIVLLGAFFAYRYFGSSKQIGSIAVMPFVNDTGNPDNEYLSDGMTETLIKGLSNVPDLSVKARSSVFRYKGGQADIKKIASDLGVQAILNGRMTQRADEITISLELIDAATENVLWTDRYTRPQSGLMSLQTEIAGDLAARLKAKLSPADQGKVKKEYTANADAYQLYLKGKYFLNKGTPDGIGASVGYLQQATQLDPKFSLAYSALADAYTLQATIFDARVIGDQVIGNARSAVEAALALDPTLSEAYTSRAWIKFRVDWDWASADEDFKRAVQLDPRSAHAHQWYGEFLSCMGRNEEGIRELRLARDLEPFSPIINWNLGKALFDLRRDDEAIAELERTRQLEGTRASRFLSILYEEKGRTKEAFDAFLEQEEVANSDPSRLAMLRAAFEKSGLPAARRLSAEWHLATAATSTQRALSYLTLGQKEKALAALKQAYVERNGALVGLKIDRGWANLRSEPAFEQVVELMKFPKT